MLLRDIGEWWWWWGNATAKNGHVEEEGGCMWREKELVTTVHRGEALLHS